MELIKNIKLQSPAKINLYLKVLKRLPSQYHLIESLVSHISLYDEIKISENFKKKTIVTFSGKFSKHISNASNSIIATLTLLKNINKKMHNKNFFINVKKNIPVGAGLGGGSSNAVTILLFLIKNFNLKINKKKLDIVFNEIGFDSHLFSNKYPKFISHLGEKIDIFKYQFKLNVLLIYPNQPNFTKIIYKKNKFFSKSFETSLIRKMIKKNIFHFFNFASNDLLPAAEKTNPRIKNLISFLKKQKICDFVQMTGSGSCCFAVFKSKKNLLKCQKLVKTRYRSYWTAMTKTIT